ncbi:MAG: hypothetical protein OEL19_04745 [Sulfurimonas sp.]|nr:hypothetical protein [Sulfurimonas sp.]
MKRVNQSISIEIKPKKLHFEDLKAIVNVLQESSAKELTIKTNEYYLDSLDDILELKQDNFSSLELKISDPYVSVDINRKRIRLYASDDTLISEGIISKLKSYIKVLKGDYNSIFQHILEYVRDISSALLISWVLIDKAGLKVEIYQLFLALYILISFGWLMYGFSFPPKEIPLKIRKLKDDNFWSRNKDTILVGVLVAVFGAILTFVLDQVKK